MPATNVLWGSPLTRLNPWYPGQFGVPGTDADTGLRLSCSGTIFYVDPNYPGASDQRDGTNPTAPLLTVAAALTKVQPQRGDVILVGSNDAWQYAPGGSGVSADYATAISEEVVIPYTASGVRIVGASNSPLGVMWTPASNGGTCITCHAIDVIIEGFVFTEGAYTGCNAVYCEWDGATLFGENLTVRHCAFDDTVDIAIQLEYSWYCNIHHNVFWENDTYGIYVDAAGSAIEYAIIHDNLFHNCAIAMALLGGCDNNHIARNSIFNASAQAGAAATNEGINLTGGDENMVFDNWFSCLLPVPANGDWDDLNTAAASDAWVGNHCMNGLAVTNPT
jgi:hypothetical protein